MQYVYLVLEELTYGGIESVDSAWSTLERARDHIASHTLCDPRIARVPVNDDAMPWERYDVQSEEASE